MMSFDEVLWNDPKSFQAFMGLPVTGEWDEQTMKAWDDMRWTREGWEQADWVKPNNWEWIHNALVSSES